MASKAEIREAFRQLLAQVTPILENDWNGQMVLEAMRAAENQLLEVKWKQPPRFRR